MRKLLNTLYITMPEVYLALDGENIVVRREKEVLLRAPLHNLESIVVFGYRGISPALMGKCAKEQIALSFVSPGGRFLADVSGMQSGNVVLRRAQYRFADNEEQCLCAARNIIGAKLYNSRWVLERALRDHAMRVDSVKLKDVSRCIADAVSAVRTAKSLAVLRGIEGDAAVRYFSVFDELILQNKQNFYFRLRSRRPPLDNVNAMLSFAYSLLTNEMAAALRAVGLDPYVGFLHQEKPGRKSLALDFIEELRAVFADRFVLTAINTRQIDESSFLQQENGAVLMNDKGRRQFLTLWQNRKNEKIIHPFLKETIAWGLVPHTQALLLARYLRGDLEGYPPFLWK